jgi:hypothetical protein
VLANYGKLKIYEFLDFLDVKCNISLSSIPPAHFRQAGIYNVIQRRSESQVSDLNKSVASVKSACFYKPNNNAEKNIYQMIIKLN